MNKVYKPWGYYENLHVSETYLVKRIVIYPDQRISLQSHKYRAENWVVVKGNGTFQLEDIKSKVIFGDTVSIPINAKHRIENIDSDSNLVFIETQIGILLSEDDIVRYSDDYGRIE